jgi:hypothetical protein
VVVVAVDRAEVFVVQGLIYFTARIATAAACDDALGILSTAEDRLVVML